jgi:hypothetical protein
MEFIYIAVIVLLIFIFLKCNNKEHAENIAISPNEAIQNLASMYNNEKLVTSKLQLGTKWLLSGIGDVHGNDEWLRFFGKDGNGFYGGIATGKIWLPDPKTLTFGTGTTLQNLVDDIEDLKKNVVRKDKKYGIQSARSGYLSDRGDWRERPTDPTNWEVMRFDEMPFK